MSLQLDLVDMRLFVNIADCNSLTRGAERSHLSLPAASTRIKNLEESIGAKLLYRGTQGVTLTPPGQAFAHHSRLVLHQLENLRGDLQEYAQGIKGHLRVFASNSAISEFLPPVLRTYLATHPDVNIDLRERLSIDVVRALTDGQTDIGLVAGDVRTEGLEVVPYRRDRLVLAVPEGHALAAGAREIDGVEFAQTLEYNQVSLQEASAIYMFLHRIAERMNMHMKMRIHVGNFEAACRMVEANVGVCILPESAAHRHRQSMNIRIVNLNDEWSERQLYVCMRSMEQLPSFARDLVELLKADALVETSLAGVKQA
ncbi:LysR family transcriptional regulator [soil metagenome]